MKFLRPGPELAPLELRALAEVARAATAGLAKPQRAMLDAFQRILLRTDLDVDAQAPIGPGELAAALDDPSQARQLIRMMAALAVADGPPSLPQVDLLAAYARALGVKEPAVRVLRPLAKGNLVRFRIAFMRHAHIRTYLRNTRRIMGGVRPMIRGALVARGAIGENTELVARFRALEQLPEDTLGHQFFRHCQKEGLKFPGEKGGFPLGAMYHDFSHLIAGYDTSPEGEIKNAAFQAGFTQEEDDFFVALFALVIHTAGVNLAPFPMPKQPGRIAEGTLAWDWLHALERGAAMKVDLSAGWDFWDYVRLPIDVVRERLGVPPRESAPQAA
jgi:hypothetical protein